MTEPIYCPTSKKDKIKLVKEIHQEVLKELGPGIAPHVNWQLICSMISDRLPKKPIYGDDTIYQIVYGHYK